MTYRTTPGRDPHTRTILGQAIANVVDPRREKRLEHLERRQMFAAVSFEDGILVVRGDPTAPNELNVALNKDGDTITASVGSQSQSVDAEKVRFIRIIGGESADIVQVDPSVTVPVYVQTGNGNDTIFTGAGDDLVRAGNGDDWVETSNGNDTVLGGNGRDTILLGAGDDKAKGGNGSDRIYGGRGNDRLYAENGDDRVWGDAGNDRVETGLGSDRARGGEGRDTLVGQASDDLMGNAGSDSVSRVVLAGGSVNPPQEPQPVGEITFSLINADTNQPIKGFEKLSNNATVDLAKLPTRNLNVRANVSTDEARSVAFSLNGRRVRVENAAPFALAGDSGGNYAAWTPTLGKSILSGTAFSGAGATGTAGPARSITVNVVDSTPAKPTNPGNGGGTATPVVDGNERPNPAARAPQAVIAALFENAPAGHAVHVNAVQSRIHSGTSLSAAYEWDFGDSGSKYNRLKGYNAAHVYTRPGQYTITLKVTDNAGRTDIATRTVTIRDAARTVYYVSSDGNDANSGRSANSPIRSWDRVRQLVGDNVEFRFRAGDTFNITSGIAVRDSNVLVGMYGSGDRPTIRWTGARSGTVNLFDIAPGTRHVTVRDLRFDSRFNADTEQAGVPNVFRPAGDNFSAINCELLNVAYFINNELKPTGVLCQENVSPLKTGLRAYLAYVVGTDQVYLGNTVANSTREHCIRSDGGSRILIAHNDFANIAEARPGDRIDIMKQTITVHWGSDVYLYDNKTRGGRVEIGPLGAGDGLKPMNIRQRLDRVVLDGNDFDFAANQRVEIDHGTDSVMIRGNRIVVRDGSAVVVQAMALYTDWPQYGQRNVRNVWMTSDNQVQGGKWMSIGRGSSNINLSQPNATARGGNAAPASAGVVATDATLQTFRSPVGTAPVDRYALRLLAA